MSHNVFANLWQIAAKAGKNRSIARFPDVCLSPPSPPAGPLPIPYPDTSFSTDLKEGSESVLLGGMPAALAQQSYYEPSMLGDESATKNLGGNVVTHVITGKTVFQAWSMDVKLEGKNVCRHIDITTSNHNCPPPGTPPAPSLEAQTIPDTEEMLANKRCPCCGEPLHDWQKKDPTDPDSEALETIPEDDFYAGLAKPFTNQADQLRAASEDIQNKLRSQLLSEDHKDFRFIGESETPSVANTILAKEKHYKNAAAELKVLRNTHTDCPNVAKNKDTGCGTHFKLPPEKRNFPVQQGKKTVLVKKTHAQRCADAFSPGLRNASFDAFEQANPDLPKAPRNGAKVNHKTPKQAGGCNSPGNTVPDPYVPPGPCKRIEQLQSELHSTAE